MHVTDRNVQTTLPDDLYAILARRAEREGRPLKAVVRAAIERYVQDPDKDPLKDFVGAGTLPRGRWSARKDWRA